MSTTLIDELNKILTNTLQYLEDLNHLKPSVNSEVLSKKIANLTLINKKESEKLIKFISKLGGKVESTKRLTDQKRLNWLKKPLNHQNNHKTIFDSLLNAEKNKKNSYQQLLEHSELTIELRKDLEDIRASIGTSIDGLTKTMGTNP